MIAYEWIVEEVDTESEDIIDTNGYDSAAEALRQTKNQLPLGRHHDIGLTYNRGNNDQGLRERQWAYIECGLLPELFDGGARIPERYRAELATATDQTNRR